MTQIKQLQKTKTKNKNTETHSKHIKKYICKLITDKHSTHSPKMVIKTKHKIIMDKEYRILNFFVLFCLDIHRHTAAEHKH